MLSSFIHIMDATCIRYGTGSCLNTYFLYSEARLAGRNAAIAPPLAMRSFRARRGCPQGATRASNAAGAPPCAKRKKRREARCLPPPVTSSTPKRWSTPPLLVSGILRQAPVPPAGPQPGSGKSTASPARSWPSARASLGRSGLSPTARPS